MYTGLLLAYCTLSYEEEVSEAVEEKKEDIYTKVDDAFGKYFGGQLASVLL